MTVTAKLYPQGLFIPALNKEIDLLDDSNKVALVTSSYSPDQDNHDYYNDLTNELSSGSGYTSGGAAVANDTPTYTGATNVLKYDGDDVSRTSSTLTARTAVLYDSTPSTSATKPLIGYQQESSDISSSGGTWSVVWNASGIFTITAG